MSLLSLLLYSVGFLYHAAHADHIDFHFHALPPAYIEAVEAAGGDPSGFSTPDWSPEAAIESLDSVGSSLGIMSISTPGVPIAGTGQEARELARELNKNFANYSSDSQYDDRLGFFGVLPDWQDVDGTLAELEYLYEEQKLCSGVAVYTTYGDKLLGEPCFAPIWEKLDEYKALIFLHPGVLSVTPKFIGPDLPQPIVDYPLATTRTAVDLIMTGTLRANPHVDIVLSHAGGTLPYIGSRALGSVSIPEVADKVNVTLEEAKEDCARFYYDIALSASAAQLDGLLDFTEPDRILFGSDFPYATDGAIKAVLLQYKSYVASNPRGKQIAPEVLRKNAVKLLNKHSLGRTYE